MSLTIPEMQTSQRPPMSVLQNSSMAKSEKAEGLKDRSEFSAHGERRGSTARLQSRQVVAKSRSIPDVSKLARGGGKKSGVWTWKANDLSREKAARFCQEFSDLFCFERVAQSP